MTISPAYIEQVFADTRELLVLTGNKDFDPNEPRDEYGRWSTTPGSNVVESVASVEELVNIESGGQSTTIAEKRNIAAAIINISSVHGLPKKSKIVTITPDLVDNKVVQGNYDSVKKRIQLAKTSPAYTRATTYHEMGHYLDNTISGGVAGNFCSRGLGQPILGAQAAMKKLTKLLKDNSPVYVSFSTDTPYKAYLLRPEEMFARAYAQYMTFKTDPDAKETILASQYTTQWQASVFRKQIMPAFDELFKSTKLSV